MKYLADIAFYDQVKCLRIDNETEFTSKPFQRLLVLNRIKHEKSVPYSSHQNGTAEQSWWTLFSMIRCLFIESRLPKTCGFTHWWLQRIYEIVVMIKKKTSKTLYKSFTGWIRWVFLAELVFVMYKIKRNWIQVVKKAFLLAMINKDEFNWFIFRKQRLFKELGV